MATKRWIPLPARRAWVKSFVLVVPLWLPAQTAGQVPLTDFCYYTEDTTGSFIAIQALPESNWKNHVRVFTNGYGWVKFHLQDSLSKTLWVEVQSHFIDSLEIWVTQQDRIVEHHHINHHRLDTLTSPVRHHYFVFPISHTRHALVYLRGYVQPPQPLKMPVVIRQPNDFLLYYQQDTWRWAAFVGMVLMAILLSLINFVFHPQAIYLYYSGYVFCISLYALLNDGWGIYLPDTLSFLDDSVTIGHWLNLGLGFFLLFSRRFLSIHSRQWWLRLSPAWVMIGLEIVLLVVHYSAWTARESLYLWSYRIGLSAVSFYALLWLSYVYDAIRRKFRPVWLHMGSVAVMGFFYATNVLSNAGWIRPLFPDMVLLRLALIADILVISVGWVYRQKLMRQHQRLLEAENQARQQETFEAIQHWQTEEIRALHLQNEMQTQRERLARDLHDGIGSQLTHIITRLDLMSHQETHPDQLQALGDFTREANQYLRETIWVLNKEYITLGAFSQRLRGWLARLWHERSSPQLHTALADAENLMLSPQMATCLFHIGQEAVTNALKHAQAGCIAVTIAHEENHIIFSVKDDGKGFDTQQAFEGYGLRNMQQRAEGLSGTFSVSSSEEGTLICLSLPMTT